MIAATTLYLRFVHGWDPLSALLGASPGSMAQVMALSTEFGADMRGIAIVQTMRVLLVTIGLPGGLALFGLAASGLPSTPAGGRRLARRACGPGRRSTAAAVLMHWIRFPGGLLFGAMAGSAVLHGSGLRACHAAVVARQRRGRHCLARVAGSRFANTTRARCCWTISAPALGSFAVAVAIASSAFVLVVVSAAAVPVADVVIAFAPGAQDTMMVLALALHLDPVYVGAHHLARFLIVTFSVALAARSAWRAVVACQARGD